MSMIKEKFKKVQPATLIAMLALFVAIGGTATAASGLINGKSIKKGTVTAKQLKNKTITKGKLKPALVKSLKGAAGDQGAPGAQGVPGTQGAQGVPGANGIIQPLVQVQGSTNIPVDSEVTPITLNVPSGKYLVTAKTNLFSIASGAKASCSISNQDQELDSGRWNTVTVGRGNVAMQAVTPAGTTTIKLSCTVGATNGTALDNSVIATPIG